MGVLLGPFRAQISSLVLVGGGHCLCVFVLVVALVVALDRSALTRLDVYRTAVRANCSLPLVRCCRRGDTKRHVSQCS